MTSNRSTRGYRWPHCGGGCLFFAACLLAGPPLSAAPPEEPYSESSLPSQYYISPSDRSAPQQPLVSTQLPSESTLPGSSQPPAASSQSAAVTGAPTGPSPDNPPPGNLPSESQLPSSSAGDRGAAKPDSLEAVLAASRDRTPWLRLVEAEHTAPLRALELDVSGQNLFTAGEDKLVHHWRLAGAPRGDWQHHATYRWQVQRAERGTILTLLSSDNELYLAGDGAEGQQGEIVGLNTATGGWLAPLVDPHRGHHSPILSLKLLSGGPGRRIVALDQQHGIGLWTQDVNSGTWSFRGLRPPDVTQQFQFGPLEVIAPQTVICAAHTQPWTIDWIDVSSGRTTRQLRRDAPLVNNQALALALQRAAEHFRSTQGRDFSSAELLPLIRDHHGQSVTCLAVDAASGTVAAGDDLGFLYVWNAAGQLALKAVASFAGYRFENLAFSRDGTSLAAVANGVHSADSIVQWWSLRPGAAPTLMREVRRNHAIHAAVFDSAAANLLLTAGRRIEVLPNQQPAAPRAIPEQPVIAQPTRVAFATSLPYRWKIDVDNQETAFDGQAVQWLQTDAAQWRVLPQPATQFAAGTWSLVTQPASASSPPQTWVLRNQQRFARLDLDLHYQRRPESQPQQVAWITRADGDTAGVAVALSGQADIWVFAFPPAEPAAPAARPPARLVRVFRGHEGGVSAIDCAPDARYLISCGQDCTLRLWPLSGLTELGLADALADEPPPRASRAVWGMEFDVEGERLIARRPNFAGPLYLRGLRDGDHLHEISYEQFQPDGTLLRTTLQAPQQMADFLNQPAWDLAVRFIFRRGDVEVPGFQSYPHWREIAAQVIAANREWALWTPLGYYDASFNGHSLFGWQINRGLNQAPDFYRADRFQATLERPDLIRRLLAAGSIRQAADLAGQIPIGFATALENSLALQPQVEILAPAADEPLSGQQATIRAQVTLEQGQELASAKAYVNGVVAIGRRQLSRQPLDDGRVRLEFSWQALLPSDRQLQVQVLCASREKLVGSASRRLTRAAAEPPLSPAGHVAPSTSKPKLFVLAAGVSQYRDSRIPRLELGAANAQGLMATLRAQAGGLYEVIPLALTDASVTANVWRSTARQLNPRLQHAGPNDVIVLFLSGHGLVDAATGEYYFVTADARYSEVVRQNYRDCLSFGELMQWADVPCRKIAILDTCHSGAIQPLDSDHLKQAVRTLQGDMVLTLTASEGDQLAAEYRGAQASLFSGAIQHSLHQAADDNGDGVLGWGELVQQVRRQVSAQSLVGAVPQFPTAGPKDLLDVVELPLARSQ